MTEREDQFSRNERNGEEVLGTNWAISSIEGKTPLRTTPAQTAPRAAKLTTQRVSNKTLPENVLL